MHPSTYQLFEENFSTDELRHIFSERTMVARWLDVEAALAWALGELELIPKLAAEEIAAKANIDNIDFDAMVEDKKRTTHELVALVRQLERICSPASARYIHWGATTQDILDSGMALQLRDAYQILRRDLEALVSVLADLAERHRDSVMIGRTHTQHALPTTFGFKVAVWVAEMMRHLERLREAQPRILTGQFGGAVGTLPTFGEQGPDVLKVMMQRLNLQVPLICWHSARDCWAEHLTLLSLLGASIAKIANELASLSATEIGEVLEPVDANTVASSCMPNKRNPLGLESVSATCAMLEDLVISGLGAMKTIHERDQTTWLRGWARISEATSLAGAALNNMLGLSQGLEVNTKRMEENLHLLGGVIMAERIALKLQTRIGYQQAQYLVRKAAESTRDSAKSFCEILFAEPEIAKYFTLAELEALIDPQTYLGAAQKQVDNVVLAARTLLGNKEALNGDYRRET